MKESITVLNLLNLVTLFTKLKNKIVEGMEKERGRERVREMVTFLFFPLRISIAFADVTGFICI